MEDLSATLSEARRLQRAGRWADALAVLDARLAATRGPAPVEALLARVLLLRLLGRHPEARALAEEAVPRAEGEADPRLAAEGLRVRASLATDRGDEVGARLLLARAEALFREVGDVDGELMTLVDAAAAAASSGATGRAEAGYRRVLELAEGREDGVPGVDALNGLAATMRYTGRLDEAGATHLLALERSATLRYDLGAHFALRGLGAVAMARADAATVKVRCEEALAIAERLGYRDGIVWCSTGLAEAARLRGDLDEAERRYRDALREVLDGRPHIEILANLGLVAERRGDMAGSRAWVEQGLREAEGPGGAGWRAILHGMILASCEAAGDEEGWRLHYARAVALLAETGEVEADLAGSLDEAATRAEAKGASGLGRATRAAALALEQWVTLGRTAEADADRARLSRLSAAGAPIPLGPFDLIAPIGFGAVGEVWRGAHHALGTPVAVKVLAAPLAREAARRANFRAEVRAVAALDHPGVVTVLDHGVVSVAAEQMSGGRLVAQSPFLVMELAEGGTLEPLCGRLPWDIARRVLLDLLDGLAHAHARGVVHRDLKPANVLVSAHDPLTVRITDFGLAHAVGEVAGTPVTMAPEQFLRGAEHGPWTDLYALGCLATVLVSGAWPFAAEDFRGWQRAHLQEEPAPLRASVAVPSGLEAWIARLLRKDPDERFRHAADAAAALRGLRAADLRPVTGAAEPASFLSNATLTADDIDSEEATGWRAGGGVAPCPVVPAPVSDDWRAGGGEAVHWWLPGAGLGLVALRAPPFVGREDERDALWRELCGVRRAGSSRVLVLSGPAGVGRSRLLSWLGERAEETGAAELVRVPGDPAGFRDGLLARSPDRAALLCADDADDVPALLELARSLHRQPPALPLLAVFVTRSAPPDLPSFPLAPLPDGEIETLARDRLGLEPGLAGHLAARADGRPQLVVELVGDWLARGLLVAGEHSFALRGGVEPPIPDSLPAMWAARMATLCVGPAGPALEVAAGLGAAVSADAWRGACEAAGIEIPAGLLERLLDGRLAVPAPGGWRFAHAMAREALVDRAVARGRG